MSNLLVNKSADVRGCRMFRKDSGAVTSRLTTPTHAGAFLMRSRAREVSPMSAYSALELEGRLHRMANAVETQLGEIVSELLAESRTEAVHDLAWAACRLIESCRSIRDRKEGGEA